MNMSNSVLGVLTYMMQHFDYNFHIAKNFKNDFSVATRERRPPTPKFSL